MLIIYLRCKAFKFYFLQINVLEPMNDSAHDYDLQQKSSKNDFGQKK